MWKKYHRKNDEIETYNYFKSVALLLHLLYNRLFVKLQNLFSHCWGNLKEKNL